MEVGRQSQPVKRSYRQTKRKKRGYERILIGVEVTAALLLVLIIFGFLRNTKETIISDGTVIANEGFSDGNPYRFQFRTDRQEIGRTESIIEYGETYGSGIHYPVIGNETMDQEISEYIGAVTDDFIVSVKDLKPKTPELKEGLIVDYESHVLGDNLVSVVFEQKIRTMGGSMKDIWYETFIYNIAESRRLNKEDIFQEGMDDILVDKTIELWKSDTIYSPYTTDGIAEALKTAENSYFTKYSLTSDYINFYLEDKTLFTTTDGIAFVSIPFSELAGYLLVDNSGTSKAPDSVLGVQGNRVIDPSRPMIAFTFDDGPHPKVTDRILNVLEANGSRATFFVMGNRVSSYPDQLKRAYNLGCEIGNHSFNHKQFSKLTDEDLLWQVNHTNEEIQQIISAPADVVRVPYGDFGGNVMNVMPFPMIQWNVDTLDWKTKNKDMIVAEIRKEVSDGDIILMHDLYSTTAEAIEEIVPQLVAEGYQLVTVRELVEAKGGTLENARIYYSGYQVK